MWGRERDQLENWHKMHYFQISPQILITEGNFLVETMQLRASKPFRDHLDIFPSKALE